MGVPKIRGPPNHRSHGWPWLSIETYGDLGYNMFFWNLHISSHSFLDIFYSWPTTYAMVSTWYLGHGHPSHSGNPENICIQIPMNELIIICQYEFISFKSIKLNPNDFNGNSSNFSPWHLWICCFSCPVEPKRVSNEDCASQVPPRNLSQSLSLRSRDWKTL